MTFNHYWIITYNRSVPTYPNFQYFKKIKISLLNLKNYYLITEIILYFIFYYYIYYDFYIPIKKNK